MKGIDTEHRLAVHGVDFYVAVFDINERLRIAYKNDEEISEQLVNDLHEIINSTPIWEIE